MIHKTPWFVKEESALWLIENDSDTIAILPKTQHTQSDARLIAAAPDLLNALRELEEQAHSIDAMQHAGLEIPPEDWSNLNTLCNIARAAINKAGGYDS